MADVRQITASDGTVYDIADVTARNALASKQDTLVSGTNIKTINGESVLGSGNITISGGSDVLFVAEYGTTTYAEISAALDANKLLFCYVSWNDIVCPYIGVVNSQYAFSNLGAGESTVSLYVNSSNTWNYATSNLATQSAVDGKQAKITASGILKGDGSGGVSAATAGTDYQTPLTAGTDYLTPTGQAARAKYLSNYYHDGTGTTGRPTSANIASDNYGGLKKILATGSMTEGKPSSDGHIIHMDWDNGTRWASQLYVSNSGTLLGIRGQTGASTATNGGWTDWQYASLEGHDHAAGDITSGTLPVNRGGTGAASFTANRAIISGSTTTGAFTTRAITNNTSATSAITGSTNLLTMNTLRYALNRATGVASADTGYTTYMVRGTALVSSETTPTNNGQIAWVYE